MSISADHMEHIAETDSYIAKGSVKIVFEGASLRSDEMRYSSLTSEAFATGNVVYEDSEAIITADKIEINLDTKLGTTYNSYVFYKKDNFHLHAGRIKKIGDRSFFLDRATVTTCDADPPEWYISGKDITATEHKSLTAWNTTLYVKKTPVLYTPYFWAPLTEKRQTGLLVPRFGYSSKLGSYYKQGYYWALEDNRDATLYLDYYDEKGLAGGLDYRYIYPDSDGELWLYYVKDDRPSRDLFEYKAYHNQKLPHNMSGYLKIHGLSYSDYYDKVESTSHNRFGLSSWESNRFGFDSEERLQKYLESNLHITKPIKGGRLYFLSQLRQNLEGTTDNIPHKLPEIGFIYNTASKGPFAFSLDLRGTHFWREVDQKGLRFDINPVFQFSYGRIVNLTQKVGLRETIYTITDPDLKEERFIAEFNTSLSTKLFKKYEKHIHLIEPSLEYTNIPSARNDKIPFFDSVDSISRTSSINYGITNRISGLNSNRIETRFRLSQNYDFLKKSENFSPLLAEATLSTGRISLEINASYDVDDTRFTETISSVRYSEKKWFAAAGKNYRRASSLDQITFEAGINRPIKISDTLLPIDFNGKIWYDLNGGGVQELNLKSSYTKQCWGFSVNYVKKTDEYQIIFAIELRGLGELKIGAM